MGARKRDNAGDQITARQELIRGFEGVGNSAFDHRFRLKLKLDRIWFESTEFDGTRRNGSRELTGGRERELRVPGDAERPLACSADKKATRMLGETWAALDGRMPR